MHRAGLSATAELLVLDVYARFLSRMTMVSFIRTMYLSSNQRKMEENAGEPIMESEIRC